jgi:uncharacterized protein YdaT
MLPAGASTDAGMNSLPGVRPGAARRLRLTGIARTVRACGRNDRERRKPESLEMLKKFMLAGALVTTSAFAQQNTDISGANFQSGKADAALAALGRKAAASGTKLIITAPPEWHARIAARVHAGGNADLVLRDGFYENVLVRVEDKSAKPAAEVDKTSRVDVEKSRAEAERAKAEAEKSRAEAEKAKAEAEIAKSQAEIEKSKAEAESAKAQQAAAARAAAAQPAAAKPAPVATPAASRATVAAPAADLDAIHGRLEQSLNNGRSANGNLPVSSLQSGDMLYVSGPVRAISRREGGRLALYWLEGDLDLRRSELKPLATDRYQVVSAVRGEGTLRREAGRNRNLEASEPAADAPARLALEKSLNEGHSINATIGPEGLLNGDLIYINGDAAAVVRRVGRDLVRYWLVGSFDLQQTGVQADGANKYRVLSDTVR